MRARFSGARPHVHWVWRRRGPAGCRFHRRRSVASVMVVVRVPTGLARSAGRGRGEDEPPSSSTPHRGTSSSQHTFLDNFRWPARKAQWEDGPKARGGGWRSHPRSRMPCGLTTEQAEGSLSWGLGPQSEVHDELGIERTRDSREHRGADLTHFLRNERDGEGRGLETTPGRAYLRARRGTEPQRARPPRCEAAPPKPTGLRVSRSGFLKRPGAASLFARHFSLSFFSRRS